MKIVPHFDLHVYFNMGGDDYLRSHLKEIPQMTRQNQIEKNC